MGVESLATRFSTERSPPTPEPIAEPEDDASEATDRPDRDDARFAFWRALLAHANEISTLHSRISRKPLQLAWHPQARTVVELCSPARRDPRRAVHSMLPRPKRTKPCSTLSTPRRAAVEAEFGAQLSWQRLNDKRASRISFTVPGGWVDDGTWPSTVDQVVNVMQRLYGTLSPRVEAARRKAGETTS